MSELLKWDQAGEHYYETGVDRMVLFPRNDKGVYENGVAWSGITAINESPSGAESTKIFADNQKYLDLTSAEDYGATIQAYTYPDEFAECDGSAEVASGLTIGQQNRKSFGFAYRTKIGNDAAGADFGYTLHLVYGAKAAPSEKSHNTVNDSPEATSLSWTITTTPTPVTGYKATAHLEVNSTKLDEKGKTALAWLESQIYGTAGENEETSVPAKLPTPDEIISHFKGSAMG